MISFVFQVIIVSILVSLFATWIRLIPKYSSKRGRLYVHLIDNALLVVFLSILLILEIRLSLILMFIAILVILWISIRITNVIEEGRSPLKAPEKTQEIGPE